MEKIGSQKLECMADVLLALPFIVSATLIAIYFAFWRTDALIRFIHMTWVLGFWMLGTVAVFAFVIPVWLKIGTSYLFLVLASTAMATAIYFTPLSRFADAFSFPLSLTLSAMVGFLTMVASWFATLRIRKFL